MSIFKTLTKWLAVGVGVLVALSGLLFVAAKTDAFDAWLSGRLVDYAAARGVRVEVEGFDFDPAGPSLSTARFFVSGPADAWSASWDRVDLRVHFLRSLFDEPSFSLSALTPKISYAVSAKDLAEASSAGDSPLELPQISFRSLDVQNGQIALRLPDSDAEAVIDGIRADWKGPEGSVAVGGGHIRWRGAEEKILSGALSGKRTLTGSEIPEWSLVTEHARAKGSLLTGLGGALKGKAQMILGLPEFPDTWLTALGLEESAPVGVEMELSGDVGGSKAAPEFAGVFRVDRGVFSTLTVSKAQGRISWKNDVLSVAEGQVSTSAGAARGIAGSLAFGKEIRIDAAAEVVEYDLRESMRLLMEERFPVGFMGSGRVSAKGFLWPRLSLECLADVEAWDLDVGTLHDGQWREWYALPHVRGEIRGVVTAEGVDVLPSRLDGGSVAVDISRGRIDYPEGLELETDMEIRNLDSVRRYLPEGMETFGRAKGRFGGPYHELTFTYDLDLTRALVYGEEFGAVKARANYDLETLRIVDGTVEGPHGKVAASGSARLLPGGEYDLDAVWEEGSVSRFLAFLHRFGVEPPMAFDGTLSGRGKLRGRLDAPVFEGRVSSDGFTIGEKAFFRGFRAESVEATGRFGLQRWEVDALTAQAYGAPWTASGFADTGAYDFALSTQNLSLAAFGPVFDLPPVEGALAATLLMRGDYHNPVAEVSGNIGGAVFDGMTLGDLTLKAAYASGTYSAQAERRDKTARAWGTMSDDGDFSLEFIADALPWEALPPRYLPGFVRGRSLGGAGRMKGRAFGEGARVDRVEWTGQVEGADAWDIPLGPADVVLSYPASLGGVENALQFDVSLWKGEAAAKVALSLDNPPRMAVEAATRRLDLSRLDVLKPLKGGWLDATGSARLRSLPPAGADLHDVFALVEGLEARGRVDGLAVFAFEPLPSMEFRVAGPQGLWEGNWSFTGGLGSGTVRYEPARRTWGGEVSLAGYDPIDLFAEWKDDVSVELAGELSFRGTRDVLERVEGKGSFSRLVAWTTGPNEGSWAVEGDGRKILYRAQAVSGVRAEGDWTPAGGYRGQVFAQMARLASWMPKRPWAEHLDGTFTGSGHYAVGEGIEFSADATLEEIELVLEPLKIRNKKPVNLFWRKGAVTVEATEFAGGEFSFFLDGTVTPGREWDIRARGGADLSVISEFIPALSSASGRFAGELSAVGPWDKPVLGGFLEIPGGAKLKFSGVDLPFEQVSAHAVLDSAGIVHIDAIDAVFGSGKIHGEGEWKLDGLKPADMTIFWEVRDVSYEYPADVAYSFDGEFLLTGRYNEAQLRGEMRLKSFLYARRFKWGTVALDLLEQFSQRSQIEKMTTRKGIVFVDLAVTGERDLRIQNNLADLSLTADLRVRGYLPNPVLWGRVDVSGGAIRFREREFLVKRSSLEFLGDVGPVAMLDGRASGQVGEYTVNIAATGPLDDVKVELTSNPSLSRTDIVALLALGTTTESLEQGGGEVTAFEATNFLIGGIQDELESEMYNVFGLDQFHIDPAYSQARQSTEPRVTIGKALGESLYARYGVLFGSQTEQNMSLEYLITPGMLLLGTWSDQGSESKGSFGAKVRFRHTFR